MSDQPWDQLEEETSKAYHRFCIYRDMGVDRSMARVCDVLDKPSGYTRYLQEWSSKYNWVARAEAWDAHELAEKTKARQHIRERARQKIIDKLDELIDEALEIALGSNKKANNTQAKVLLDALDRAGITVPKDINLNLSDKRDRIQELSRDVDDLEDEELIELIEASSQDTGESIK